MGITATARAGAVAIRTTTITKAASRVREALAGARAATEALAKVPAVVEVDTAHSAVAKVVHRAAAERLAVLQVHELEKERVIRTVRALGAASVERATEKKAAASIQKVATRTKASTQKVATARASTLKVAAIKGKTKKVLTVMVRLLTVLARERVRVAR